MILIIFNGVKYIILLTLPLVIVNVVNLVNLVNLINLVNLVNRVNRVNLVDLKLTLFKRQYH